MGGFGAYCTGCNKGTGVSCHIGLPETLLQEGEGAVDTRMTGKPGVVSPLKDLRPDRVRNKKKVSGAVIWVGVDLLGFFNKRLDLPGYCSHHAGCKQDGVRAGESGLRFREPGR